MGPQCLLEANGLMDLCLPSKTRIQIPHTPHFKPLHTHTHTHTPFICCLPSRAELGLICGSSLSSPIFSHCPPQYSLCSHWGSLNPLDSPCFLPAFAHAIPSFQNTFPCLYQDNSFLIFYSNVIHISSRNSLMITCLSFIVCGRLVISYQSCLIDAFELWYSRRLLRALGQQGDQTSQT